MKDVMIIADFCGDFNSESNNRFLYIADYISSNSDNRVELVTSDFDHGRKEYFSSIPLRDKYKITMLHELRYSKNVCVKRFVGHYSWAQSIKRYLHDREKKPDAIICAMPPISPAYAVARYCKANGIKFIIDIQDLWPETFKMVFNTPFISDAVFLPLSVMADRVYKSADVIIAVSETSLDRAVRVNTVAEREESIYLGTDLSVFDDNIAMNSKQINKPDDELWIGYCGSLGDSYDLESVIKALTLLKTAPKLIVMGDGEKKSYFEELAKKEKISSLFTGMLPYGEMCRMLKSCDMAVNPIVGSSVASIINKHADYAAAGIPVINTQNSDEYRKLVDKYQMGLNCICEDPIDIAKKIKKMVCDEELRIMMGKNSRKCAVERFDRRNTYRTFLEVI